MKRETPLDEAPTQEGRPLSNELEPTSRLPALPNDVSIVGQVIRDKVAADLGARVDPNNKGRRIDRVILLHVNLTPENYAVVMHWLASAERGSIDTKRGYVDDLLRVVSWVQEETGPGPVDLLGRLTSVTVTNWVTWADGKQLAVRTQRRTLSALSSLFNFAIEEGIPITNPVRFKRHAKKLGTSTSGRHTGATPTLNRDQVAALVAACDGPEERLVLHLLAVHGLRESEIVAIRIDNISGLGGPQPLMHVARKGGKWVTRKITGEPENDLTIVAADRTEGILFTRADGKPIDRHWIINMVRRVGRHAAKAEAWPNPPNVSPHMLRGSAITNLLDQGKPLQEVQQWAGHVHSTTTQGYWERSNAVERDAALSAAIETSLNEARAGITTSKEDTQ